MKNILYDYYGIYVEKIDENGFFIYQSQHYLLCTTQLDEKQLTMDYLMYEFTLSKTSLPYFKIVKNKYGQVKSMNMVLFSFNPTAIDVEEVIKSSLIGIKQLDISQIKNNWIHELDKVENQTLPAIMGFSKKFDYLYAMSVYYLGMGECALSYLLDYCTHIVCLPMSYSLHQDQLNEYIDWIHLFNYKLNLRISLMSRLYRLSYIDILTLEKYIIYLSNEEIIMLFIDQIFPTDFFKHLSLFMNNQKDEAYFINQYSLIEIEEKRIKDLYLMISKYVHIRPIEWL